MNARRTLPFVLPIVIVLVLAAGGTSFALRCKGRLVSEGDTKFDVIVKCGEPVWVEKRTVTRIEKLHDRPYFHKYYGGRSSTVVVPVEIEEWMYNFGPRRFIQILRFENGRLVEIETGGYGY
ncbi:MAG: DUF2845 domain-containing protein [Deltaproteobacteria bacterium]|nr:DUF2845 domain-containing protein [Deltaproteobacteria bacterium]